MTAKRILITGASSGIGRALSLRYAAPSASLALFGRDAERLESVARDCRGMGADVETFAVDVRDRNAMQASVEEAHERQPIDLLIANAGVATGLSPGQILENPEAVRGTFAINVLGVFNTVEPAILPMCERGRGHIAMVGSMAGVRGLPYSPAYCATKAAVHLYADSLRGVLAQHGVNVSLIVPGFMAAGRYQRPGGGRDYRARTGARAGCDCLSSFRLLRHAPVHDPAAAPGRFRHEPDSRRSAADT
jgi:NADP-dependent 3-hydroxy acid dehydrogenase YdfG